VQVDVAGNAADGAKQYVVYQGKTFYFQQFHFHGPSEHHVGENHYTLELHAVHKATDGQLLVVGIFIKDVREGLGVPHFFRKFISLFPAEVAVVTENLSIDFSKLLSETSTEAYWAYSGSRTSPPFLLTLLLLSTHTRRF
jgi:carbonic anhydrase